MHGLEALFLLEDWDEAMKFRMFWVHEGLLKNLRVPFRESQKNLKKTNLKFVKLVLSWGTIIRKLRDLIKFDPL